MCDRRLCRVFWAFALLLAWRVGMADDRSWTPGSADHVLPGLIPAPAELTGVGRWQLLAMPVNSFVEAITVSPDGEQVAFSDGRYVRIHDAETYELLGALVGHRENIRAIDWSKDGRWIATGAYDGEVRIWNSDRSLARTINDHFARVRDVAWRPDSQLLATASEDGTIRCYAPDATAGTVIEDHQAPVNALAWSPDGRWLVAGDENRMIRWWTDSGSPGPAVQSDFGGVVDLKWSPNGQWLASASSGIVPVELGQQPATTARIWSADASPGAVLRGHRRAIYSVAWTADSQRVVTAAYDSSIRSWSLQGEQLAMIAQGGIDRDRVFSLARNPQTGEFAAGARFGVRTLTADGPTGSDALNRTSGSKLWRLDWNPTRDLIAVAGGDGVLHILSADLTREIAIDAHERATIMTVRWSPDGNVLATCSSDRVVKFWSPDGEKLREQSLENPGSLNRDIAWTPDGRRLAAAFQFRGNIVLMDDHQVLQSFSAHPDGGNYSVSFAPDGLRLASGGSDTTLRITQLTKDGRGQTQIAVAEGFDGDIDAVVWSPDGKLIATGHASNVKLWSPDATEVVSIPAFIDAVMALDWRPDSQAIAAADWDTGADIFSTDGTLLVELPHHSAPCYGVSFSPDGSRIATCGWDGLVRVLNAEDGSIEGVALIVEDHENPIDENSQRFRHAAVTFNKAGQILHGDRALIERQFAYVVESADGRQRVLKPSEFFEQAAGAILVSEATDGP